MKMLRGIGRRLFSKSSKIKYDRFEVQQLEPLGWDTVLIKKFSIIIEVVRVLAHFYWTGKMNKNDLKNIDKGDIKYFDLLSFGTSISSHVMAVLL